MSVQTKDTLKTYFNTGDKPTEANFADLIDSLASESTTTTVESNSATWSGAATAINVGSIVWNNTTTTVSANSATWDNTYTTVNTNSASWAGDVSGGITGYETLSAKSLAIGTNATFSYYENSIAIGYDAQTIGIRNIAIGTPYCAGGGGLLLAGSDSIAIGSCISIGSTGVIAIGVRAGWCGAPEYSVLIGDGATGTGSSGYSIAIGYCSMVGISDVAIGSGATAVAGSGIALGGGAIVSNTPNGIAIGAGAATSAGGIALGYCTASSNSSTITIGHNSLATGCASVTIGGDACTHNGPNVAIGYSSHSTGSVGGAVAIGLCSGADGSGSIGIIGQANADYSVQIGDGCNNCINSLNFRSVNILFEDPLNAANYKINENILPDWVLAFKPA